MAIEIEIHSEILPTYGFLYATPLSPKTPLETAAGATLESLVDKCTTLRVVSADNMRICLRLEMSREEAVSWLIRDIRIDGVSSFGQPGFIPADMFAVDVIKQFVIYDDVCAGDDIAIDVVNIGPRPASFHVTIVGEPIDLPSEEASRDLIDAWSKIVDKPQGLVSLPDIRPPGFSLAREVLPLTSVVQPAMSPPLMKPRALRVIEVTEADKVKRGEVRSVRATIRGERAFKPERLAISPVTKIVGGRGAADWRICAARVVDGQEIQEIPWEPTDGKWFDGVMFPPLPLNWPWMQPGQTIEIDVELIGPIVAYPFYASLVGTAQPKKA